MIPFVDLPAQYEQIGHLVEPDILTILRTGAYVNGPYVERFEQALANYLDLPNPLYNHTPSVVGVSNGTDAITLALEAFSFEEGTPRDRWSTKAIVPNNSFIASAFGATRACMHVVPVDVNPDTYLLDPNLVEDKVKKDQRIRAVIVTHLYGQQPDMKAFRELADRYKFVLLEDAAQSIGSTFNGCAVGTYSDVATTSFYPTKNLGGCGQGGAVITRNAEVARRVRRIANQGSEEKYKHWGLGGNFRLDAIVAAHLYHALTKLNEWNKRRQEIANIYNAAFGSRAPKVQEGSTHIYHLYELRCKSKEERLKIESYLKARKVSYAHHYPQTITDNWIYRGEHTPIAEVLKDRLISLPMFPTMTEEQALEVVGTVLAALE